MTGRPQDHVLAFHGGGAFPSFHLSENLSQSWSNNCENWGEINIVHSLKEEKKRWKSRKYELWQKRQGLRGIGQTLRRKKEQQERDKKG